MRRAIVSAAGLVGVLALGVVGSLSLAQPPSTAPTLPQFVILVLEPAEQFARRSGDGSAAYWGPYMAYAESLQKAGAMLGGQCVTPPETGRVLGEAVSGLRVGGYFVVQAASLEEASKLAADCPSVRDGGAVDVRPIHVTPNGR